jgi:hypothetical protein
MNVVNRVEAQLSTELLCQFSALLLGLSREIGRECAAESRIPVHLLDRPMEWDIVLLYSDKHVNNLVHNDAGPKKRRFLSRDVLQFLGMMGTHKDGTSFVVLGQPGAAWDFRLIVVGAPINTRIRGVLDAVHP